MSVVGFDPDRVIALRLAMRRAADGLLGLRSADPGASDALDVVAAARRALTEHWDPMLQQVLATGALTDTAWLTGPVDLLVTDRAAMRLDDWTQVCTALGEERLAVAQQLTFDPHDPALLRRLDEIDAALLAAASSYADPGPHGRDGHVPWRPHLLDTLDPSTAALLLPGLGLDDRSLAVEAARLLGRERDGQDEFLPWPDQILGGDNAGDLVFALLVERPHAAAAFLDLASVRPELLFRTAENEDIVAAVIQTGTDPSITDAAAAGDRLRPLIAWAREFEGTQGTGDGMTSPLPSVFGAAIVPWLLSFGARADGWGWDEDDADDALRWVVADDHGLDAVSAGIATWSEALGTQPLLLPDGRVDLVRLDELTAVFDQVGRAVRDAGLDDAAAVRFRDSAVIFMVTLGVSAAVPGGFAVSFGVDAGLAAATAVGVPMLQRWGVMRSDDDEAAARSGFGSLMNDAAVAAVVSVAGQAIAEGKMPADALDGLDLDDLVAADEDGGCSTDELHDRLHEWIRQVAPLCDPTVANALPAVVNSFMNQQTVDVSCGR